MVLRQSLDIEKGTTSSLQSQLQIVANQLEFRVGMVKSQEEMMTQLNEQEQKLKEEIANLQRYINDKLTDRDSTS